MNPAIPFFDFPVDQNSIRPKFDSYSNGYGFELKCPFCEGAYLRHELVEVFECEEDKGGIHVSVAAGKFLVDDNMENNPSKRRHGLSIHFRCEQCDSTSKDVPVLTIVQHKGHTLVDFKRVPKTTHTERPTA